MGEAASDVWSTPHERAAAATTSRALIDATRRRSTDDLWPAHAVELEGGDGVADDRNRAITAIVPGVAVLEAVIATQPDAAVGAAQQCRVQVSVSCTGSTCK